MNRKEFYENTIKQMEEYREKTGLQYALIVWLSPLTKNLEKRFILSNNYCELLRWIENEEKNYFGAEHNCYINGVIR